MYNANSASYSAIISDFYRDISSISLENNYQALYNEFLDLLSYFNEEDELAEVRLSTVFDNPDILPSDSLNLAVPMP